MREIVIGLVGTLAGAAILGVLAWGADLHLGLRDLYARTGEHAAALNRVEELLAESARQLNAQNAQMSRFGDELTRLAEVMKQERAEFRADLRDLSEITRQNSLAIQSLIALQQQPR